MRRIIILLLKFLSSLVTQLLLCAPNKKKYFVFSAKYGFSDNSKYLFLYYLKREINCVWVAADNHSYDEVVKIVDNYPHARVVKRNSLPLLFILAKAKYVFVTHSFLDLGILAIKNCLVINLWHGIPIKKMGYDSINDIELFSLDSINPYISNDFLIASSQTTKPFLMSCMKLSAAKVLPLGQPRNDFLFDNKNDQQLINELKIYYSNSIAVRVFLFAPTFRDKEQLSKVIYTDLISSFSMHANKDDVLVLRLHPKERILLAHFNLPYNVKLSAIDDVQEELLAADILISDYSSIIFDFSILARPILLYTPDKDSYFNNRGGSYFDYDDILQECMHIETSELDSVWGTNFKECNFTKLASLHSRFACKNIHDQFN